METSDGPYINRYTKGFMAVLAHCNLSIPPKEVKMLSQRGHRPYGIVAEPTAEELYAPMEKVHHILRAVRQSRYILVDSGNNRGRLC